VKTAEEIDVEKCNFHNFGSSVTLALTLDRVESHRCAYLVEIYPHQIRSKSEKKTFCGRTDGRTDTPEFQSTRSPGDDLRINGTDHKVSVSGERTCSLLTTSNCSD